MRFYYPRALVRFSAMVQLSRTAENLTFVTDVVTPRSVVIERNDYNTADKCKVQIDAREFPVLPRLVRQVLIQVYAGDAGAVDAAPEDLQDDDSLIRFIGYVDAPEMAIEEDDSVINWEARDYTALLLDVKRPSVLNVPTYSDRLDVALRRILDSIPGGENIGLELQGLDEWPELSRAAPKGLKDAAIPVNQGDTLWHFVKRACDPVALIPRMVLDKLVVGTSRGLRAPKRRAVVIVGEHVQTYKESKNLGRIHEGIGLSAYDTVARKQITALYPPEGDPLVQAKKKVAVKKHRTVPVVPGSEDKRQWFPYPNVSSQEALNDAAERLYHERSRQEFEGQFTIARFGVPTDADESGDYDFDVTGLENGDRIFVVIDSEHRRLLSGIEGFDARVRALVDRGFSEQVAPTLVRAFEENADGPLEVYVRKATHKYEDASYELVVEFQNLLTLGAS